MGTIYGGDGRTTFGLPDLRGRVPIHAGSGAGLTTRTLGRRGGSELNTLLVNQLPSHTHGATVTDGTVTLQNIALNGTLTSDDHDPSDPSDGNCNGIRSGDNVTITTTQVQPQLGNTGEGQGVENMQPWLAIHYVIALQGQFPSRNRRLKHHNETDTGDERELFGDEPYMGSISMFGGNFGECFSTTIDALASEISHPN